MVELRVPEIVEDPFREHYRALILGSLLRSAEAESARHRASGHRVRARRAERIVENLRPPAPVAEPTEAPAPTEAPRPPVLAAPQQPAPILVGPPLRLAPARPRPPAAVPEPRIEVPAPPAPLLPAIDSDRWFGPRIRRAAAVVWVATFVALVADVVLLGVDSYATAAADLALVAVTFVWFFACIDDLIGPSS